jgi:hypothetical protein
VCIKEEYAKYKVIGNMSNKVIGENFLNLKKEMAIKVQEAFRTPNNKTRIEPSHSIL